MKYRTALSAVFAKYRNPRTRSHAVSLLERYSSQTRPVTAWHAVGEDADASRLLLETLGFKEDEHFAVQTSVLDPKATRFSWNDAGIKLLGSMAAELRRWDGSAAQRRVLAGTDDPLELVPETETAAEPPAPAGGGIVATTLETTAAIARSIERLATTNAAAAVDAATLDRVLAWARTQADGDDCDKAPVAPLAVLEAYARMRGDVAGLPGFQVFDAAWAPDAACGWQASRPMAVGEAMPIAGRINMLPLTEQKGRCGPVDGYLAWHAGDWKRFSGDRGLVWTQFDAPLRRTVEALQFALDAEKMRAFVCTILESAYSVPCGLVGTTRLAVGNSALGGVPGNENLEDDDGDTSQLWYRIEDSAFPYDAPVYMGAHLMWPGVPGIDQSDWSVMSCTRPVPVSTGAAGEDASAAYGLRASEIADEWFLIAHGGTERSWTRDFATWSPLRERRETMERNLPKFRAYVAGHLHAGPELVLAACSPENPDLNRDGDGGFTVPGAFVNGVAAAMRKCGADRLQFVQDSRYHPDKIFAGIWSGIATDLAPSAVRPAAEAGVFPNLEFLGFASGDGNTPAMREQADAFVELMRRDPQVQLRFGRRTSGVPRRHMVVIETNVAARPFVEAVAAREHGGQFVAAVWREFYSAFLTRRTDPLPPLSESYDGFGRDSYELSGFEEWIAAECPDWLSNVRLSRYGRVPHDGFSVGWLEDSTGRLLLVVSVAGADISLRVKTAWRYASSLPVPSATYLAAAGRTGAVVLTDAMTADERYKAVLNAAVHQPGFVSDCSSTRGSCGTFGTAWIRDAVWDMDRDEIPSRGWYLNPGVSEDPANYAGIGGPF